MDRRVLLPGSRQNFCFLARSGACFIARLLSFRVLSFAVGAVVHAPKHHRFAPPVCRSGVSRTLLYGLSVVRCAAMALARAETCILYAIRVTSSVDVRSLLHRFADVSMNKRIKLKHVDPRKLRQSLGLKSVRVLVAA